MKDRTSAMGNQGTLSFSRLLSLAVDAGRTALHAIIAPLWRRLDEKRARSTESTGEAQRKAQETAPPATAPDWDAVDEASLESFPASDPPAGWAGRDIKPDSPLG